MKLYIRYTLFALAQVVWPVLAQAQTTLQITASSTETFLFWSSPGGGTNGVLQITTDLAASNWSPATNALPAAHDSQTALSWTNAGSARFFRLNLIPPTADGMAIIPAGPFTFGNISGDSDIIDAVPTNVYVSAFYMDTNLVNYGRWQGVYTYAVSHGYGFDNSGSGDTVDYPVQTVNWYDVVKWCNARSQQAGLTPVYYTDVTFSTVYTNDISPGVHPTIYPNWLANGYRLPTEAEWEKAARGGWVGNRFPLGDTISHDVGNYFGDTMTYTYDLGPDGFNLTYFYGGDDATSPVGSFIANNYGLYDMAGNVFEWCWDWSGTPYGQPTSSDPTGPASGTLRILRGGSWFNSAAQARCAFRSYSEPANALPDLGFRSVRAAQ